MGIVDTLLSLLSVSCFSSWIECAILCCWIDRAGLALRSWFAL